MTPALDKETTSGWTKDSQMVRQILERLLPSIRQIELAFYKSAALEEDLVNLEKKDMRVSQFQKRNNL